MRVDHLTILGAGLSGLSCAYHFPESSTIYEAKSHIGGTASSMHWQGFTFDYGPHISFTKDAYIQKLLAQSVQDQYLTQQVANANYYQGTWIRHPAICNLCDLPPEVNRDALLSFIEVRNEESVDPRNYREWCELGQGKYFAENFTHIYTRKFWTIEPEEMTYQWAGERVARPNLKRVIDGALGLQKETGYYYTEFRYPKVGGYGAYSNFWQSEQDRIALKLNHKVTHINLKKRTLSFLEQPEVDFGDYLISSLPLPEFVKLVPDAPEAVKVAAEQLRATSIALVNIALNQPSQIPYHWCYIYDEEILAPRLTVYSNLSPENAPENCTALQAEVPYTNHRPLPTDTVVERVVQELAGCGILNPEAVVHAWQVNLKYGYVIFDRHRDAAVQTIHTWMREHNIEPIGRFGLWQYLWSDEAIKSGKRLAESIMSQTS